MKLSIIGLLCTMMLLQACSAKKNAHLGTKIIWVSGYKTECDSTVGKGECYVASHDENLAEAKWEKFYRTIEGFEYDAGYLQKIEVKAVKMPKGKMAADNSSVTYQLVKVLEKQTDTRLDLQAEWTLTHINSKLIDKMDDIPKIKFDLTKKQLSGSNGCNNFAGMISNIGMKNLKIEREMTTLRACGDVPIAGAFDTAFNNIHHYKFENGLLKFYNELNGEILSFTSNTISKTDTRINDIWVAIKIGENKVVARTEMPRIEINLNSKEALGNDGCNEFRGKIKNISETEIAFGALSSTKKMCQDMEISNNFNQALQKTVSYKYTEMNLIFYDKAGKDVITFLKLD